MDLITLDEYKAYKNIANPEKDDILRSIVSAVSDLIKNYCGRTFIDYYYDPKTEYHTIKPGMNAVIVNESPIRLVSMVNSLSTDVTNIITVDSERGIIYHPKMFDPGPETVSVTYTGGYEITPYDIKLAAFELVDYYSSGEHKSRKSFGGTTIEYHPSQGQWPFHISAILDMYRDV